MPLEGGSRPTSIPADGGLAAAGLTHDVERLAGVDDQGDPDTACTARAGPSSLFERKSNRLCTSKISTTEVLLPCANSSGRSRIDSVAARDGPLPRGWKQAWV